MVVHGELPEGHPWALVFGLDDDGPAADVAIQTPSVNVGIAHNRATGTLGRQAGAANCHGGYGHRLWVWISSDSTTGIELATTDRERLAATPVHHDPALQVRLFLAVTDDWTTTVRAARHHRPDTSANSTADSTADSPADSVADVPTDEDLTDLATSVGH